MIEKIREIKSPLTVIVVFCTIAEVSATAVLPTLDADLQQTYMWFVICFSFTLLLLFFGTINLNWQAIHSAEDRVAILKATRATTPSERIEKLSEDILGKPKQNTYETTVEARPSKPTASTPDMAAFHAGDLATRAQIAEELVIQDLVAEFGSDAIRNRSLDYKSESFAFDAVFDLKSELVFVEIKFIHEGTIELPWVAENTLKKISSVFEGLPNAHRRKPRLLFAFIEDFKSNAKRYSEMYQSAASKLNIKADFKLYEISHLLKRAGLLK